MVRVNFGNCVGLEGLLVVMVLVGAVAGQTCCSSGSETICFQGDDDVCCPGPKACPSGTYCFGSGCLTKFGLAALIIGCILAVLFIVWIIVHCYKR
mmetsp:Transcript_34172/g.38809  ORF Transcript_34172/g.38809 Transcript_34172/m.38809 type:complete len:96 (+) Transcript_34172:42-329(+)